MRVLILRFNTVLVKGEKFPDISAYSKTSVQTVERCITIYILGLHASRLHIWSIAAFTKAREMGLEKYEEEVTSEMDVQDWWVH